MISLTVVLLACFAIVGLLGICMLTAVVVYIVIRALSELV